ncbi:MAG TPA: multidrug efflux SMR transporter [Candidatus Limnocylindrales bacterium]
MNGAVWLAIAIAAEVTGTVSLKASNGLHHHLADVMVVAGYGISFFSLSQALNAIPLGLAYAIWSGIGTLGAVVAGRLLFGESLGLTQIAGVVAVIGGVSLLNAGGTAR